MKETRGENNWVEESKNRAEESVTQSQSNRLSVSSLYLCVCIAAVQDGGDDSVRGGARQQISTEHCVRGRGAAHRHASAIRPLIREEPDTGITWKIQDMFFALVH